MNLMGRQVFAADLPDLPRLPLLHPDGAHLVHACGEGLEESGLVPAQLLDHRPGPAVRVQRLVRREQAHPGLQVAVVHVVEVEGRAHVEGRHDVVVAAGARARHAQRLEEPRV